MVTKYTVALVGGIVIVVSIVILITETLTSPNRCMPTGEASQTERNWLQKTEPVSSPSTTPSPRTIFPSHSTNLPSLGDAFAKNSSPQPGTLLSTVIVVEEEMTPPSTAEEASDRHQREDRTVAVNQPQSSSTTVSSGNLVSTRRIIITPNRKCGSNERKDSSGYCRPIWWLGQLTDLAMPQHEVGQLCNSHFFRQSLFMRTEIRTNLFLHNRRKRRSDEKSWGKMFCGLWFVYSDNYRRCVLTCCR